MADIGEERRARAAPAVLGLLAISVGVPLIVSLVVLRQPRWYPGMDLALTELLVRDVGSSDTPMVGLIGRFHALGRRGSHPGPLSFWAMWPFYRLFGSSAWALQVASAALNLVAAGLALWLAHRRGGRVAALGVAVALVALARTYGADKLTEPWNPHIPLLWWVVFVLAVWSVLCDDLAVLPLVVFAGSFCAQTHISYLGLVGGVGAVMAAALGVDALRRRSDHARLRRLALWGAASLGLLVLLWLPPLIEQLTSDPGNLAVLRENFTTPEEAPVGWGPALDVWLSYLDVPALLGAHDADYIWARRGSAVPGAVLLAVWAGTVVAAWRARERHPELARLHLVVAASLLFGLVAVTRILGLLVYWVVLWLWGTTVLVLIAVGWTLALLWSDRAEATGRPLRSVGPVPYGVAALAVALLVGAGRFTYEAAHVEPEDQQNALLRPLPVLAPPTVDRLSAGDAPGGGLDGRYILRWDDSGGWSDAVAYGLLLELERHGFDVRTPELRSKFEVPYRWSEAGDPPATAYIDFAVGEANIEHWEQSPGAVRIASFEDPDDPAAVFVHATP